MTKTAVRAAAGVPLALIGATLDSWILSLEAENKSPYTIRSYCASVRQLAAWAESEGIARVATEQLRAFLAAELRRRYGRHGRQVSPASVALARRNLRVYFGWLTAEEPALAPVSPMTGVGEIIVPENDKPPFSAAEQAALLATCKGSSFAARRDLAIMSVFCDTGIRVSGCAGLRLRYADDEGGARTDVRLKDHRLAVKLKGGRVLIVPIGRKTAADLDRYIRIRAVHKHALKEALWLAPRGAFTSWGIRQMMERRGARAGIIDANPHRWRNTFAHDWLDAGGSETDLMEITGWKTRAMIEIYAKKLRQTRAGNSHARLSPRDRI
jgi:site-specific recombinase XerC